MYSVGYPKLGAGGGGGGGGGTCPLCHSLDLPLGGWTHFREFKGPDTYRSAGRREIM